MIKQRSALVTGAGKGLGDAFARGIAADGCAVMVNNRSHEGEPSSAKNIADSLIEQGFAASHDDHAVDGKGAWQASVSRLEVPVDGAGDLMAAVFTGATLRGEPLEGALAHALASTHGVLRQTAELGVAEMALVAAQGEIATPSLAVTVTPLT